MKSDLVLELHKYLADELKNINDTIISCSNPDEELVGIISTHLINSGGKRIRPIINIISAIALGYKGNQHINLAAAVEFIHVATLLHDDVVDESDMRRKNKTANFLWGNKASILVGDFLFSQSFKLMVRTGSLLSLDILSSASAVIAEGEVMQLRYQGVLCSKEQYYKIISSKTAQLFAASAASGAAIAGVSNDYIESMRKFGLNLGLIFQIRDDALDYFGNSQTTGKNIGQDFKESKCTLPIIMALEKADKYDREFLENSFSNEEDKDFKKALSILHKLNIESEIKSHIKDLHMEAIDEINSLGVSNQNINYLKQILDFATNRDY